MTGPLDRLTPDERAQLRPARAGFVAPMLATLTEERFSDPAWVYERKLDGVRVVAARDGRGAHLWSRSQQPLDDTYPELVDAVAAQVAPGTVLDGEIVAFDGGRTSFERLQGRSGLHDRRAALASGIPVFLYAFDVPVVDGHDVTALPLRTRKRLLRVAVRTGDPLRVAQHRNADGEAYLREACARGWEGLIAKRADAPYRVGRRSPDWLKLKCLHAQELVIGGWTDPEGSRTGFGALLVGYHEDGRLRYAGKVGTGFDRRVLDDLGARMRRLDTAEAPFADPVRARGVHWVRPELVAQIGFSEWTRDGRLRHPRYLGLREDKAPEDVVREEASSR
ncbi:non-homologous end-joining DNA ligase [Pseudonocardia sp. CA-107938]|uniref:non-homologous end-joining DNA ligase n=1 Tax=Pseudonocardia sp. CA-107938 TaxID=3240021 RepID=UPI003D8CEAEE